MHSTLMPLHAWVYINFFLFESPLHQNGLKLSEAAHYARRLHFGSFRPSQFEATSDGREIERKRQAHVRIEYNVSFFFFSPGR